MAISFDQIPSALRLPFAYTEFDPSGADQGLSSVEYTVLLIGQMLPGGTAQPLARKLITGEGQGAKLFGEGSMLAGMCDYALRANSVTRTIAVGILDNENGAAAKGLIDFTGAVTSPAPLSLYIGGELVQAPAPLGSTAAEAVTALTAAINAADGLDVTAQAEGATLALTARHLGDVGNDIDLRFGYYDEAWPEGLTAEITPMSGGAGNPDVADIIASLAEEHYFIACPYTDRANLTVLENELLDRWGPIRQSDGQMITVKPGNFAEFVTYSESRNSHCHTALPSEGSPTASWKFCAVAVAVAAYYGNIDRAKPFNGRVLTGVKPGYEEDRFSDFPEKNQSLFYGGSALAVSAAGQVVFKNLITTYRFTPEGASSRAYLSLTYPMILSYLRADWNNYMTMNYPRHKLASDADAGLFGAGQEIMTPSLGKAEAVGRYELWVENGLVEGLEAFKEALIVEIDGSDVSRLNFLMRPNLVNPFNIMATKMRHII